MQHFNLYLCVNCSMVTIHLYAWIKSNYKWMKTKGHLDLKDNSETERERNTDKPWPACQLYRTELYSFIHTVCNNDNNSYGIMR